MAKAIAAGIPKMRIEEAAARTQARIDSGTQTIVGVNKYQVTDQAEIEVLKVDNKTVRESQIAKLAAPQGRARSRRRWRRRWRRSPRRRATGAGNLLELAVAAARAKATVGEISDAMEKVWGRHRAETRAVSGVYTAEAGAMNKDVERVRRMCEAFAANDGRRPRILVAKMGQDGHDRGQKVIASAFADLGFDVDIGPLFATPDEAARQAVENDVHIIGVSSLAAGHLTLVPDLTAALEKEGRGDIMIVVGGVIPPADYRRPVRGRRQGRVRPRHQHPRGRRRPARQAQRASWATGRGRRRSSSAFLALLALGIHLHDCFPLIHLHLYRLVNCRAWLVFPCSAVLLALGFAVFFLCSVLTALSLRDLPVLLFRERHCSASFNLDSCRSLVRGSHTPFSCIADGCGARSSSRTHHFSRPLPIARPNGDLNADIQSDYGRPLDSSAFCLAVRARCLDFA